MSPILIVAFVIAALVAGAGIGWTAASFHHRLKALEAEKRRRDQTAVDSRGRMRVHHSYNTLAALEDSTSLLIDAAQDLEAMRARVETTMAILQVLRESPGG